MLNGSLTAKSISQNVEIHSDLSFTLPSTAFSLEIAYKVSFEVIDVYLQWFDKTVGEERTATYFLFVRSAFYLTLHHLVKWMKWK